MDLANTCTCIFGEKRIFVQFVWWGFGIFMQCHMYITLQKILTRRSKILWKNIHRYNIYWQSWYLFVLIWFLYFTISVSIVMKEVTGKWFKTVSVLHVVNVPVFLSDLFLSQLRHLMRKRGAQKYMSRIQAKKSLEMRRGQPSYETDPTDDVFVTIRPEDAEEDSW